MRERERKKSGKAVPDALRNPSAAFATLVEACREDTPSLPCHAAGQDVPGCRWLPLVKRVRVQARVIKIIDPLPEFTPLLP